jgi:hypothetical protein
MEPAPGYDARLPHDLAHFVVENELGITSGVFAQLAAGGHAGTFQPTSQPRTRKDKKRGNRIAAASRDDAGLSERIVWLACETWKNNLRAVKPVKGVSVEDIKRVCREFDAVSAIWSKLEVGESMTLVWRGTASRKVRNRKERHQLA